MAFAEFSSSAELIKHYKRVRARIFPRVPPTIRQPAKVEIKALALPAPVAIDAPAPVAPPDPGPFIPPLPVTPAMLRKETPYPSVDLIKRVVSHHYQIALVDLVSARRTKEIVEPRQVAMWLARSMTPSSLPVIGRKFGNRDHTTVLHAFNKIEHRRLSNPEFSDLLDALQATIMGVHQWQ